MIWKKLDSKNKISFIQFLNSNKLSCVSTNYLQHQIEALQSLHWGNSNVCSFFQFEFLCNPIVHKYIPICYVLITIEKNFIPSAFSKNCQTYCKCIDKSSVRWLFYEILVFNFVILAATHKNINNTVHYTAFQPMLTQGRLSVSEKNAPRMLLSCIKQKFKALVPNWQ